MRTKQDTEYIVTDYILPGSSNEYILVCIQRSIFKEEEVIEEEVVWKEINFNSSDKLSFERIFRIQIIIKNFEITFDDLLIQNQIENPRILQYE